MICKKSWIYLRLSELAAALADKTAEETKVTLVSEGGVSISGRARRQPFERVRECLFVEMSGHAGDPKARAFPIRVAHHRIKMAMSRVPAAVIRLR